MSEHEEVKGPGFVVKDHRHSQKAGGPAAEKADEPRQESPRAAAEEAGAASASLKNFQIDFSTFILSLASSAFYHLEEGQAASPEEKEGSLSAVKQTIDILLMLGAKTAGNLTADEKRLMDQLVYELQVKFVNTRK